MALEYKTQSGKIYVGFEPVYQPTGVNPETIFVTVWLYGDFDGHYNVEGDEGIKSLLLYYEECWSETLEGGDLFYRAFHPI
jgi:hypothetical protein